jgi:hypothetical protein
MIAFFAAPAFSQTVINPSDIVYSDFQIWETRGLIANLPPLRPYPIQLVQSLLNQVIEKGPESESEKAARHFDRLFGKKIHAGAEGTAIVSMDKEMDFGGQLDGALLVLGNFSIKNLFSFSFDLGALATTKGDGLAILPYSTGYRYETYDDHTNVGPINIFVPVNAGATFGSENMWFQAGMSRSSWGDFYDNGVVLSPEASHVGNMSFVVNQPTWNYTQSLVMLSASTETGDYPFPEKFLAMHSVSFYPRNWLEITYYESSVYGQRIEPIYLLPVPFMLSQQLLGYAGDNIQMGLSAQYKPFNGFSVAANVFLDDIKFEDIFKFKFDTKLRTAAQLGVIWAPGLTNIKALLLDYTLVTPYTYAHYDYSHYEYYGDLVQVNFQNYTHNGKPLVYIPPNSDRVSLKGKFEFFKDLRLNANFTFLRHANVNESLPIENIKDYVDPYYKSADYNDKEINTGGGVLDAPNAGNGQFDVSHEKLLFMEQATKQYTFQFGLDAVWELPRFNFGTVSLMAGYVFEFILNDGVDNQMYSRLPPHAIAGNTYTQPEIEDAINSQKKAWLNNLHNSFNNYFTVGMRIVY